MAWDIDGVVDGYRKLDYEKGMGAAYKNSGILFKNQSINNGGIPAAMTGYLVPGDELGIVGTENRVWVIETPNYGLLIVDKNGVRYNGSLKDLIVLRSGR